MNLTPSKREGERGLFLTSNLVKGASGRPLRKLGKCALWLGGTEWTHVGFLPRNLKGRETWAGWLLPPWMEGDTSAALGLTYELPECVWAGAPECFPWTRCEPVVQERVGVVTLDPVQEGLPQGWTVLSREKLKWSPGPMTCEKSFVMSWRRVTTLDKRAAGNSPSDGALPMDQPHPRKNVNLPYCWSSKSAQAPSSLFPCLL